MTDSPLNYPPPWMDAPTLCKHICISPSSIDNWVAQGILPPARKRGGKLMWKWEEVDSWLTDGRPGVCIQADTIRENVKQMIAEESREKDESRRLRLQREVTRVRLREKSKALNSKPQSEVKE